MVTGEVIQIVKGVLGQAQEVLGLLLLKLVCLDRDAQGKDRATGLTREGLSAVDPKTSQEEQKAKEAVDMTYLTVGPVHHVVQGQIRPWDCGGVPPYRQAEAQDDQPEGEDDL